MNISRLLIIPLSREAIARLVISPQPSPFSIIDHVTVSRVATPFSGIARLIISALSVLCVLSASAQNVNDFLINEKTASTGRVTQRSWPKGANTLWGTDANGLPQKIILGAGLSLGSGSLIATAPSGITWSTITSKPTTLAGYGIADSLTAAAVAAAYAPLSHTQAISTITGLQAALDAKSASSHTQAWSTITSTPTTLAGYAIADSLTAAAAAAAYAPISHTQAISTVTGLQAALDAKSATSHTQAWSTITSTPTTLAGYGIADSLTAAAVAAAYAPLSHTQAISTVTGLQAALDDRVLTSSVDVDATPDSIALRDENGALFSQRFRAIEPGGSYVTTLYSGVIEMEDQSTNFLLSVIPPASLTSSSTVTWPSVGGTLLTVNSSLAAANLTGTIATARLPGTITGLTSVTSTTFVGALTGTASGNLVAGGALGTPSSGVLTNCTSIPAAQLTGTINTARLPATITGLSSVTSTTFVGALTGTASGNAILGANTFTADQILLNSTAAINGTQQASPNLVLEGRGWATTGSASQSVRVRQSVLPVQGTAPTATWRVQSDINNAGTWPTLFSVSANVITTGGFNTLSLGTDPRLYTAASSRPIELATTGGTVNILESSASLPRLGFTATANNTNPEAQLVRQATGFISQRRGTDAQRFEVANTYTSGTNNEVAVIDWQTTPNTLRIGTDKGSGGGSNRAVQFVIGGTAKITLDTAGNIVVSGLPTSAPAVTGALWIDTANANVLKVVP